MRQVQHCGQISSGHRQQGLQVTSNSSQLDTSWTEIESVSGLVELLLLSPGPCIVVRRRRMSCWRSRSSRSGGLQWGWLSGWTSRRLLTWSWRLGQDPPSPWPRSDRPHQCSTSRERDPGVGTQQEAEILVTGEGGEVSVHQGEGVEDLNQRLDRDLDMCQTSLSQTSRRRVGGNLSDQSPERGAE